MKTALILLMVFLAVSLEAEERVQTSRTLFQFGLLLTKGDDTGWSHLGPGFTFHSLTYFDPSTPDGWYYGILDSALSHAAGGIVLADARLVTIGWRGDPFTWWGASGPGLQFDIGAAPTIGARIRGSTILGSLYTGIGLTVGLGIPVADGQDVGLSWEPVFPVTSWGSGDAHAPNRGYMDFVLSWTMKSFVEVRSLPWSSRQK